MGLGLMFGPGDRSGQRQDLDVFLDKTIFKPLDMTDTAFSVPPEKLAGSRRITAGRMD
jgi:CubicO group peptidase (beta-lactamase class C family)